MSPCRRFLCDAPDRSYGRKLELFARFAEPELRTLFTDLDLPSRGAVLDLGCGIGHATALLSAVAGPAVTVIGLDLSLPHLKAARNRHGLALIQGDAEMLCCRGESLDFIWSCNTVNHLTDATAGLAALRACLRRGGRLALAQSGFLPEMYFAWDAPLDDAVRQACHRYYRERYGLALADTSAVRALFGTMRKAGLRDVTPRTCVIERTQPLSPPDRDYFQHAIFEGVWGQRIHAYLDAAARESLERLCDPASPDYCLDRADFHHIQTLTVCVGRK